MILNRGPSSGDVLHLQGSHRCWFAQIELVKWMTLDLGKLTRRVPTQSGERGNGNYGEGEHASKGELESTETSEGERECDGTGNDKQEHDGTDEVEGPG